MKLASSVQNRGKFGSSFVRLLYFLFGPFELCGRKIGQLASATLQQKRRENSSHKHGCGHRTQKPSV
jgi:hypothetical protein